MFEELTEAKKAGTVRFAGQSSAVTNADQIRKLLRVLELAQSADVCPFMKDLQMVGGSRTWAGKWTIVSRLPGISAKGSRM